MVTVPSTIIQEASLKPETAKNSSQELFLLKCIKTTRQRPSTYGKWRYAPTLDGLVTITKQLRSQTTAAIEDKTYDTRRKN